jgi:hypothetical protein
MGFSKFEVVVVAAAAERTELEYFQLKTFRPFLAIFGRYPIIGIKP